LSFIFLVGYNIGTTFLTFTFICFDLVQANVRKESHTNSNSLFFIARLNKWLNATELVDNTYKNCIFVAKTLAANKPKTYGKLFCIPIIISPEDGWNVIAETF
jgi:hypothetical protein